jgi:hypothetical protein
MTRTLEELREYLVGEWKFDNNFLDTSGNGNHGVPTDVEWKPTERGMKPKFNGSTSKISISSDDTDFVDEMTFHVKFSTTHAEYMDYDIISKYFYDGYHIALYGNRCKSCIRTTGGYNDILTDIASIENNTIYDVVLTFKANSFINLYLNGSLVSSISPDSGNIVDRSTSDLFFGYSEIGGGRYTPCTIYESNAYSTALDADEVLALYNSTKHAYGIQPADRSFSHDVGAVLGSPEGAVFTTDMHTKNADGTLIDLSGNSNHGTINGAVRAGGYFRDGLKIGGVYNNGISTGYKLPPTDFCIEIVYTHVEATDNQFRPLVTQYRASADGRFHFSTYNNVLDCRVGAKNIQPDTSYVYESKTYYIAIKNIDNIFTVFINGNEILSTDVVDILQNAYFQIGRWLTGMACLGNIYLISVSDTIDENCNFNKLAVLPLYELDCSKLPANTTEYSTGDFLPNSSIHVNSGEFQIVADAGYNQIKCVNSGSLRLLPAWEWDGDEYLTLIIDGEAYSNTGTITQEGVTASIEQGSPEITVSMTTGNMLDGLNIKFREPVEVEVEI